MSDAAIAATTTTPDLLLQRLLAATSERTDERLPPARFSMLPRDDADADELAARVEADLASLGARVEPLSELDKEVRVLVLPARAIRRSEADVFEAAYALADAYGLQAAEPAYPANVFPEPGLRDDDIIRDGREQAFIPGCEVPREPLPDDWALALIRAPQAWAFSAAAGRPSKGAGIVLAQPDTGVTRHAELQGVNSRPGFDFVDDDPDPTDPLGYPGAPGHGTATGSVIVSAGAGRVSGAAPSVTHMPIRAIRTVALVSQVEVARAIDWAVAQKAHVISMSLGGLASISVERAIGRAVAADVIVLAAAGNCITQVVWPARYDECIAVAGVNHRRQPWSGSCRGPAVDISAPGENVWAARAGAANGTEVSQGQGTSFAVALAASAAALWLAHHGRDAVIAAARAQGVTVARLFRRLVRATSQKPPGWDATKMGAGIVDCEALLKAALTLGQGQEAAPAPQTPERMLAQFVSESAALANGREAAATESAPAVPNAALLAPEISLHLLRSRLPAVRQAGAELGAPSPRLSAAAQGPLRGLLGEARP